MIARLQSEWRKQALLALAGVGQAKYGLVNSWQLQPLSVKVTIQPEGFETGWIPFTSGWAGPGWGMVATPVQGAQVLVIFQEGHPEAGVAIGGLFSDEDQPPGVSADKAGGEFFLVHAKGQAVHLTNDGGLSILGSDGQSISMDADGNIASAGTWTHTGDFSATGEVTAKSQGQSVALSAHVHGITGGPETTAPLPE